MVKHSNCKHTETSTYLAELTSRQVQDRNLTGSGEWRQAIQEVDAAVLSHLRTSVTGGFDEEQFGNRVGFANLKL